MNKCFAFLKKHGCDILDYCTELYTYTHSHSARQTSVQFSKQDAANFRTLACWVDIFFADKESMEASFILHCGRSKDQAQQLYHRVST